MNRNSPMTHTSGRQHMLASRQVGFGLIEVLVSLVILAVGLLGLGALQSAGLSKTSEARNRTQAVFLAEDMFERVRANRANIDAYDVAAGDPLECDETFAITNGGVATDDVNEWQNSVACLLPQGVGSVDVVDQRVTITLIWEATTDYEEDGELTLEADI